MIPITDTSYLKKGFQFRFRNYATVNGSQDHWHIDYVYLNRLRKISDTVFIDISWVYKGTSVLKNYQAMPWKQYNQSEVRAEVLNLIRNNDKNTRTVGYNYQIIDDSANTSIGPLYTSTTGIYSFSKDSIYTHCDVVSGCFDKVTLPTTSFPSSLSGASQFTIMHYFNYAASDLMALNDTLREHQVFSNYFAYDDGTAENSVGLVRNNAQLALKFTLNVGGFLN